MDIPKKIKIGAHTYKIRYSDDIPDIAQIDRTKNEILLHPKYPKDQQEAALFHEILHGINNELDHSLLDSLAEQMYQSLRESGII